jgi:hypothetical protein
MSYPDKFVHKASDIPNEEHWAIIKTDGVYIPGDERSRTNPGHGYPAETRNFIAYGAYLTEASLLSAIKDMEGETKEYKVIKVTPVKIMREVSIRLVGPSGAASK